MIRNREVLEMDFIPFRVVCRDGQIKALVNNLKPVIEGGKPRNSFLFGPTGTGKTCIARYVLEEFSKETGAFASYINCWRVRTRFNILYELSRDLGMGLSFHRKGTPVDEIALALERRLEEKPCVLVLDEVDQIEETDVIYDLLTLPNMCLIMISNNPHAFYKMDPRIMSRLASTERIEFPVYRKEEIVSILRDRVEWGLFPGVISIPQLEKIAETSSGDARVAIEILRICAEEAERRDLNRITDDVIARFTSSIFNPKLESRFSMLNPYQKLIINILKQEGEMTSGKLFKKLNEICRNEGLQPVVDRTFRKYTSSLLKSGFISVKRKGKNRIYDFI